jgi:hypothetical protein
MFAVFSAGAGMPGSIRASQSADHAAHPTDAQRRWLARGLDQPGGKLPLFDIDGRRVPERTIRACIAHGWAEKWFENPLKRDWLVCRLTHLGRVVAEEDPLPRTRDP